MDAEQAVAMLRTFSEDEGSVFFILKNLHPKVKRALIHGDIRNERIYRW